jgi:hypothetical protein
VGDGGAAAEKKEGRREEGKKGRREGDGLERLMVVVTEGSFFTP